MMGSTHQAVVLLVLVTRHVEKFYSIVQVIAVKIEQSNNGVINCCHKKADKEKTKHKNYTHRYLMQLFFKLIF